MSLHEEESNHVVNLKRVFGIPPRYGESGLQALSTLPALRDVDYLVVCPFGRGTMGYQGIAEQDVYDVLADVKRRYPVDEDRVYLTGASMGGGGALWLALTRPDVWAAVAPVCADVFPGTSDLAPNALNLPVRLFHGDLDPSVRVESSRQWQRRLLTLDSPVEYIEFPGIRHNAWDFAYKNGNIFEWFAKYRRNRQSGPRPPGDARPALSRRLLGAYRRHRSGSAGFGGCGAHRRRRPGADAGRRCFYPFYYREDSDHRWSRRAPSPRGRAFVYQNAEGLDAGPARRHRAARGRLCRLSTRATSTSTAPAIRKRAATRRRPRRGPASGRA